LARLWISARIPSCSNAVATSTVVASRSSGTKVKFSFSAATKHATKSVPFGILTAIGGSNFFLYWVFSSIGQIITAPFVALVNVLLYLDLRARHEGLTSDRLASELDSAQA